MSYGDPAKGWNPWVLTEEQGRPLIRAAIEAGVNFFDTANIYSNGASEEVLGRADQGSALLLGQHPRIPAFCRVAIAHATKSKPRDLEARPA
jgi:predicted oxidoreductase